MNLWTSWANFERQTWDDLESFLRIGKPARLSVIGVEAWVKKIRWKKMKWTGSDSNAGLFACKANTLPTELRAQLIQV
ncbi:hypothetical protein ACN38_g3397 [Penicillium nordicum]|uniref:Uncharacterized protein n=1 Tax=Penicillium nordicum TaxID=229535 RepID=A0A0M9WI32_9EURO|nr:hypothetical protein ACN38_g3397 [Penicillium nordicum]